MELKNLQDELKRLSGLVEGWMQANEIPAVERDLALEKLRRLYETLRFEDLRHPLPHAAGIAEEPPLPVAIDLGEVLSLDTLSDAEPLRAEDAGPLPEQVSVSASEAVPVSELLDSVSGVLPVPEPASATAVATELPAEPEPEPEQKSEAGSGSLPEPGPSEYRGPATAAGSETAAAPHATAASGPATTPVPESAPASDPAPIPAQAAASVPALAPAPASASEPASGPVYTSPTLFGPEEETIRHRHKQRVIMSLYDTEPPRPEPNAHIAEKAAAASTASAAGNSYSAAATPGGEIHSGASASGPAFGSGSAPASASGPVSGSAPACGPASVSAPASGSVSASARAAESVPSVSPVAPDPAQESPATETAASATAPAVSVPETAASATVSEPDVPAAAPASAPEESVPAAAVPVPSGLPLPSAPSGTPESPAPAPVLGDVINHDVQTLADTIAPPRDVASELRRSEPVTDLGKAIGINDKFLMIRDLFGGDAAAYEAAIRTLNGFDNLDDCMIHIAENYAWNANSDGAKYLMELLERKFA